MPVKRRLSKRREDLDDEVVEWLGGGPEPLFTWESELPAIWAEYGPRIVADWIEAQPGTRPARWWDYEAPRQPVGRYPGVWFDGTLPEPRRRLGGIGTPTYEVLAYVPEFALGLPRSWVTSRDVEYYGRDGRSFDGVAIDPNDPPRYESQAAYLERHGLFAPGERRRLKPADFEPEVIRAEVADAG